MTDKNKKVADQALFLDLDDTLLDGSGYQESIIGTCRRIAELRRELEPARLVEANNTIWQDYWEEIGEQWTLGILDDNQVRLEAWRRTLRACECDDEETVQFALKTHAQLQRKTYRLFDDVKSFATSAMRAGIPLALVTNGGSETQRDKLQTLDIGGWFDAVVISGEVGVAKPDASVFALALEKLSTEIGGAWHIGDSLINDVAGARAAGLTSVWVNRRRVNRQENDPEPDYEISSLSELMPLLRKD